LDNQLPKIIWLLWLQGHDKAPLVVRKCYGSWVKNNPGWQVIFLDEHNISDHTEIKKDGNMTDQAFSDILRINLLAKYGGIWADATSFCTKPLDSWLDKYLNTGFFAFERPGADRMISSWFIASSRYNYITNTYKNKVNAYWHENPGMNFIESSQWRFLNRLISNRGPQAWFNTTVTKVLKVYPYFWFHYLFENIYLRDNQFREMWDGTIKLSADVPHQLQTTGLFNMLDDKTKAQIDNKISPVYKLTWKFETDACKEGTVLDYLLRT
jgi:hypothetical protein